MLANSFPLFFLDTYTLFVSSPGCKPYALLLICLFYGLFLEVLHSSTSYLIPGMLQVLKPLMWFLLHSLVSRRFLVLLIYFYLIFLFHLNLFVGQLPIFQITYSFLFFWTFRFFLDLAVKPLPSFIFLFSLLAWTIFPFSAICKFFVLDVAFLSFKMSIEFLFSRYFRSASLRVVSIVFGRFHQSSNTLFYVVFESYRCIKTILMLLSPLPVSFPDTYNLPMWSLGCNVLCVVFNFLVLHSIF